MKKISLIAAAIFCLAGCTKEFRPNGNSIVGGNEYYAYSPSREYMMAIADNMVTDVLEELETAFKVEELGNSTSIRFDKSAGSILEQGIIWKVIAQERALRGMTIKNIGSDTWEMAFEGPYSLLGDIYPVNFPRKLHHEGKARFSHFREPLQLGCDPERKPHGKGGLFLHLCNLQHCPIYLYAGQHRGLEQP